MKKKKIKKKNNKNKDGKKKIMNGLIPMEDLKILLKYTSKYIMKDLM